MSSELSLAAVSRADRRQPIDRETHWYRNSHVRSVVVFSESLEAVDLFPKHVWIDVLGTQVRAFLEFARLEFGDAR
ncbi:hypothetical protein [Natrinema halophilum]|uniref:Uncharacterized protein n=1 Tax=Natrinema halophilum TaxID=1699371 RepID=A0A7D5KDS3_9EURY|nr:hypothetical protein [Natrinema halophilum]QLG49661.1 hypothetical protein HYG82_12705 [Natrinema halophilum]